MIKKTAKKTATMIAVIHIGDNTQSQDHVMTFVNFRTINATVRRPAKPIPPDDDDVLFFILFLYWLKLWGCGGGDIIPPPLLGLSYLIGFPSSFTSPGAGLRLDTTLFFLFHVIRWFPVWE